jgi:hypothetical protein
MKMHWRLLTSDPGTYGFFNSLVLHFGITVTYGRTTQRHKGTKTQ